MNGEFWELRQINLIIFFEFEVGYVYLGAYSYRDSIVSRIQLIFEILNNIIILESEYGGFGCMFLYCEQVDARVYVSFVRIFVYRILNIGLNDIIFVVVQSILSQIMIGFSDLSNFTDSYSDLEFSVLLLS